MYAENSLPKSAVCSESVGDPTLGAVSEQTLAGVAALTWPLAARPLAFGAEMSQQWVDEPRRRLAGARTGDPKTRSLGRAAPDFMWCGGPSFGLAWRQSRGEPPAAVATALWVGQSFALSELEDAH